MDTLRYTGPHVSRGHSASAGIDLYAAQPAIVTPGMRPTVVSTGVRVALPLGVMGMISIRSGCAAEGLQLANAPGIIDPGYRDDIRLLLIAQGDRPISVTAGQRVAQLIPLRFEALHLEQVVELPESEDGRGNGGFGSTGN